MKPRDRTERFPNIGLIEQSNTRTPGPGCRYANWGGVMDQRF